MAPSRPQRVSIGFAGGQVLSLRLTEKEYAGLEKALDQGGWHGLTAEEGTVRVNVGQVVYVRLDSDEQRVGFGS